MAKDRCAIEGEVLFWYADESHDASCGEDVGLVEGAGVEEAFGVFEGDEDGGDGSLVSLG